MWHKKWFWVGSYSMSSVKSCRLYYSTCVIIRDFRLGSFLVFNVKSASCSKPFENHCNIHYKMYFSIDLFVEYWLFPYFPAEGEEIQGENKSLCVWCVEGLLNGQRSYVCLMWSRISLWGEASQTKKVLMKTSKVTGWM